MMRISTNMPNDDMQYHSRIREWRMNTLQNKMAEQTRIKELRDDPVGAAHSTRYQSHIYRLNRFLDNTETLRSNYKLTEDYVRSTNDILHRVREIAIQGANSTYSKDQKKMMAVQINELLNELVGNANARSGDGNTLFSGDKTQSLPFRVLSGNVPGADGQVITSVMYTGAAAKNMSEVSENSFMPVSFAGNNVFWAEQNEVMADSDATGYVVMNDTAILIDGSRVELKAGDNVQAIIAKINNSEAGVKASLDPVKNSLVIQTTFPHQLWMEDEGDGTTLSDLGILSSLGRPPFNVSSDARTSGGSMFDMVIFLRDALFNGDTLDVGGAGLKGIDLAQNVVLSSLAEIGSQYERLEVIGDRLSYEIPEMINRNSKEVDLDLSEAIMNLKMYEYTHKAALQTAGRILQPTLLDFLR